MTIKEINDQINRLKSFRMNIKESSKEQNLETTNKIKDEFTNAVRFRNLKNLLAIFIFVLCLPASFPIAIISSLIVLISNQMTFYFQKKNFMEIISCLEATHQATSAILEDSEIQIECLEDVKKFKKGKELEKNQIYRINKNLLTVKMIHDDIDEINKKYETSFDIYKEYQDYLAHVNYNIDENALEEELVLDPYYETKNKTLQKTRK